ncbi:MAG: BspA family leucine-rich repeat surface protein [Segatella copri]|nr:BspA family leucine-rich repeat surface protein [Segatella copri]
MGGAKFCRFALFPLMLLMLLLLPTRMVAETTTEDPRYTLFNSLDGISDVTITDNGSYPWKMLDLKADGMESFTIPDGSKGLMSSNYHVDGSSSETVVNFTVEKPMLLAFKYLVSSEYFDKATITLDNKKSWTISEIKQIEIKELLSVGKHSLKLSYTKDGSDNENADRTCIYDLKTATTFSEYVADYVATNSTLTFKKITSDNLEGLDLSRMAVVDNIDIDNIDMVQNVCTNYSSIKNIVFDESFKTYAPTSLSGFFNGCKTLETISGLEYLNTANVEYMDNMFNGCSALTSLDLTKFNTANVEFMYHMFKGCSALTSLDLTKFNTAKVTYMNNMFEGCSALKSLDLTNFNTAKVTDMSFMFKGCSALTSLDLTKFNTAKVVNMGFMFYDCSALTSLDLTNFNTANVVFMDNMFNGCSALKSLDLTNFNTAKVVNMYMMFNGCSALESLDLTNFNTAKVTYMNNMFEGCSALTTIYASDKFVTDNVKYGLDMFTGCKSLKDYSDSKTDHTFAYCGTDGYFTPGGCGYAEYDLSSKTLTFRYKGVKPEGAYALNEGASEPGWLTHKNEIKEVVFNASFANARPTSCYYWFSGCKNLTDIEGIENLNTENVTNMNSMFDRCSALTSLDLTNFNTAKVSDMSYMFMGCYALTTIFVSDKFVTNQVTSSDNMFHMCINLIGAIEYDGSKSDHTYANYETGYFTPEGGFHAYAEFDGTGTLTFRRGVSKPEEAYDLNEGANAPEWSDQSTNINKVVFDASFANARPTSCYEWFNGCYNLTEIEGIENLNTEEVTNMGSMFSGCYDLTQLDLSNFDTQNVENMSDMFVSCLDLKSLNVSNFDTQKVKDMNFMFYHCPSLTSLDVSNFNTQNVENMRYMFSSCSGLTSLDLSNFDTKEVTNMSKMFWDSSALKTIYVSDKFVTTKVSSGANMFQDCENLKGFIDYISNKDKDNNEYANYKTGYFSKLVGKNGEEKIGAAGETLATENLVLDDGKDFVAYEPFVAKNAFYIRVIPEGSTWGTLCLPFAIDQSQETGCKFYRLTGIDNDNECITLESYEGAEIPAGTPVLFKMNKDEQTLSISVQNAGIVTKPKAGTNTDVNLVGSFTKIGGNGNQGLAENDYIIGKDKFWRVSDLNDGKGVGIKPMRAYIHPTNVSQARAAMLSIGKGDGTTAIDNLNAISNDANAEYYDANGRRTNGLQKGLNIVKRGSKTYKIMVN